MPLFYQHNINQTTKLAVWNITEPEDFFLEKVHLRKEIRHPHKRLQHLAGRYLLRYWIPAFLYIWLRLPIRISPFCPMKNIIFQFRIAEILPRQSSVKMKRAGIDVELIQPKIERIKHKFLSGKEQNLLPPGNAQLLTLLWSCKEAVYKWYGRGEVDFISHIVVKNISINNNQGIVTCRFMKETEKIWRYRFISSGTCAWHGLRGNAFWKVIRLLILQVFRIKIPHQKMIGLCGKGDSNSHALSGATTSK